MSAASAPSAGDFCVECWTQDKQKNNRTVLVGDEALCEPHALKAGYSLEDISRAAGKSHSSQRAAREAAVESGPTPAETPAKASEGYQTAREKGSRKCSICGLPIIGRSTDGLCKPCRTGNPRQQRAGFDASQLCNCGRVGCTTTITPRNSSGYCAEHFADSRLKSPRPEEKTDVKPRRTTPGESPKRMPTFDEPGPREEPPIEMQEMYTVLFPQFDNKAKPHLVLEFPMETVDAWFSMLAPDRKAKIFYDSILCEAGLLKP